MDLLFRNQKFANIPNSNAIHSGCSKIFVISEYLSSFLNQHIFNSHHLGAFSSIAIELILAEQGHAQKSWFQETVCAIRQNLHYFTESFGEYFLILSGEILQKRPIPRIYEPMRKLIYLSKSWWSISAKIHSNKHHASPNEQPIYGTFFASMQSSVQLISKAIPHLSLCMVDFQSLNLWKNSYSSNR